MQREPSSILAVVPNWLGDVVMCTPALRALAQRFPEARLAVAGRKSACDLLEGLAWISEFSPIGERASFWRLWSSARTLGRREDCLAVVFPHSFRAALFAWLSGAERRVGYARAWRSWLLTDRAPPHRVDGRIAPMYMADEYLALVRQVGCANDGAGLELHADARAVAAVKERLVGHGPWVGIAPGAAFGPSKQWPAERFARVIDEVTGRSGGQCILLSGPGEEETREAVLKAAAARPLICDEGNPTVAVLKAVISQLDLLVCNDSGPRHVAVAFGVPTVCIMGSTSPAYSEGPYERGRVLRVDVDCGPCQKPVCATDHRCMTSISPEEVLETVWAFLPNAKV